jgi:Stage II sporulation protein E (SpoIIE)
VEVIPDPIKAIIAALAGFALAFAVVSLAIARRARRLRRQRGQLLEEVGLLQRALLPSVPDRIGALAISVAYRPADGPGAGGDFYDVFALAGGRVAVIVGDVSGHGREALPPTTLTRYTLRAYLDAGLPPRRALQLGSRVLDGELDDDFATVVVAVYEPADCTLSYACAGHPVPIVLGPPEHEPVTACSSPPLGMAVPTGFRQTTVTLPAGSLVCFYTDGLIEARADGKLIGRHRVASIIREAGGNATAKDVLDRLARDADHAPDDMAACMVRAVEGSPPVAVRVESLELDPADLERGSVEAFLEACGIPPWEVPSVRESAREATARFGGATLRVRFEGVRRDVAVLPRIEDDFAVPAADPTLRIPTAV